jgi:DNA-binding transcriptional regulator GbsR (MarR family)
VLGDRRDHFTTMKDIWEIFRIILDERKRREIDPTLEVLQESVTEMEIQAADEVYVEERVKDMLDFFETVRIVYEQYEKIPTDRLKDLFRMSNKLSLFMSNMKKSQPTG